MDAKVNTFVPAADLIDKASMNRNLLFSINEIAGSVSLPVTAVSADNPVIGNQ
jgi:hypothetical protein